jgi:hypothetical protein
MRNFPTDRAGTIRAPARQEKFEARDVERERRQGEHAVTLADRQTAARLQRRSLLNTSENTLRLSYLTTADL